MLCVCSPRFVFPGIPSEARVLFDVSRWFTLTVTHVQRPEMTSLPPPAAVQLTSTHKIASADSIDPTAAPANGTKGVDRSSVLSPSSSLFSGGSAGAEDPEWGWETVQSSHSTTVRSWRNIFGWAGFFPHLRLRGTFQRNCGWATRIL